MIFLAFLDEKTFGPSGNPKDSWKHSQALPSCKSPYTQDNCSSNTCPCETFNAFLDSRPHVGHVLLTLFSFPQCMLLSLIREERSGQITRRGLGKNDDDSCMELVLPPSSMQSVAPCHHCCPFESSQSCEQ